MASSGPQQMVERLERATNAHDLEGIVACFAHDYVNETPVHPAQGFVGCDQVRRNWEQILAFVPDISARVLRLAVESETVWSEWEMIGTRHDGTAHHMCGVILFGVRDDVAHWARFYLEPVNTVDTTVNDAVLNQVRS